MVGVPRDAVHRSVTTGAAPELDLPVLSGLVSPTDRIHQTAAVGGPITRSNVDMSGMQTKWTMVAVSTVGQGDDVSVAVEAVESGVLVASAHPVSCESREEFDPRHPGFGLFSPTVATTVGHQAWRGRDSIHRRDRRLLPAPTSRRRLPVADPNHDRFSR